MADMNFKGKQVTKTFHQINYGSPEAVFPLLCPQREKDWLEGWDYDMIYSQSGGAEQDCVFLTHQHGQAATVWQVTQYHPNQLIEFVRVTPGENLVKITIQLIARADGFSDVHISYQYTGLNPHQNTFIETELEASFQASMEWWEKAINHYLKTGTMLRKS